MPCIHPTECSIDIYTVNVKRLNFFEPRVDVFKYQHMTQYSTSAQQVKIYDKTSSVIPVAPKLWEVDQCFNDPTYQRLKSMASTHGNEFGCSYLNKRLELTVNSSGFEILNQIGKAMTDNIGLIVGHSLQFMTSKYWLDLPSFGCQTHADSEEIFVSYQVYLSSSFGDEIRSPQHKDGNIGVIKYLDQPNNLTARGAMFLHVDPPVQIEFKPNHGYINLNSDLKPHRVDGTWDTRISVMFQYSRV